MEAVYRLRKLVTDDGKTYPPEDITQRITLLLDASDGSRKTKIIHPLPAGTTAGYVLFRQIISDDYDLAAHGSLDWSEELFERVSAYRLLPAASRDKGEALLFGTGGDLVAIDFFETEASANQPRKYSQYPGIEDQIRRFERAILPECPHCGSFNTADVQIGIIGRTIHIAAATKKFKLIVNGPKPGEFYCNACKQFFDAERPKQQGSHGERGAS
jgi:hypothetical protein